MVARARMAETMEATCESVGGTPTAALLRRRPPGSSVYALLKMVLSWSSKPSSVQTACGDEMASAPITLHAPENSSATHIPAIRCRNSSRLIGGRSRVGGTPSSSPARHRTHPFYLTRLRSHGNP